MKKKICLIFLLMILLLSGCIVEQQSNNLIYTIDTSLVDDGVNINEFSLDMIKININNNSTKTTIAVNESMISEDDYNLLQTPGQHTITVIYKNKTFSVSILLKQNESKDISYSLHLSNLKESYKITDFNISDVKIRVDEDNKTSFIDVTNAMLSSEDISKLKTEGTHTIKVAYGSFSDTFTVTLVSEEIVIPTGTFSSTMSYYRKANGKTGTVLKQALRDIIAVTTHKETYDDLKTDTKLSDADPDNSNNILLFYSRVSVKGKWDGATTWNREHVWAQSLGWFSTSGAGADLHHLRPEDPSVNSTRGNRKFGEIRNNSSAKEITMSSKNGGGKTGCYYSGNYFEPQDCVKGDVARIIFYLMTRYSESDSYSFTSIAQSKDLLLKWNAQDPVDSLEKARNEAAYKIQGNRNPFIDHPEAATMIWGTYKVSYEDLNPSFEVIWYIDKKHDYAYL